jgi:hypothetical protein
LCCWHQYCVCLPTFAVVVGDTTATGIPAVVGAVTGSLTVAGVQLGLIIPYCMFQSMLLLYSLCGCNSNCCCFFCFSLWKSEYSTKNSLPQTTSPERSS